MVVYDRITSINLPQYDERSAPPLSMFRRRYTYRMQSGASTSDNSNTTSSAYMRGQQHRLLHRRGDVVLQRRTRIHSILGGPQLHPIEAKITFEHNHRGQVVTMGGAAANKQGIFFHNAEAWGCLPCTGHFTVPAHAFGALRRNTCLRSEGNTPDWTPTCCTTKGRSNCKNSPDLRRHTLLSRYSARVVLLVEYDGQDQ
jgi:hypothetical protein